MLKIKQRRSAVAAQRAEARPTSKDGRPGHRRALEIAPAVNSDPHLFSAPGSCPLPHTSTTMLPSQEHTLWLFNNLRSYFITYFITLAPHASGGCILPRGFPAVSSSEERLINEIIVSYIRLTLLNNISTNISFKEKKQHCFLLTLNCSVCMCYAKCF